MREFVGWSTTASLSNRLSCSRGTRSKRHKPTPASRLCPLAGAFVSTDDTASARRPHQVRNPAGPSPSFAFEHQTKPRVQCALRCKSRLQHGLNRASLQLKTCTAAPSTRKPCSGALEQTMCLHACQATCTAACTQERFNVQIDSTRHRVALLYSSSHSQSIAL